MRSFMFNELYTESTQACLFGTGCIDATLSVDGVVWPKTVAIVLVINNSSSTIRVLISSNLSCNHGNSVISVPICVNVPLLILTLIRTGTKKDVDKNR